jgi:biotin-(acetyl-CoA carboxylase) ligase
MAATLGHKFIKHYSDFSALQGASILNLWRNRWLTSGWRCWYSAKAIFQGLSEALTP